MKYSVSDVARVLGMTPSALHYFEREGLISVRKEPNGHRFYSIVDIFRMLSLSEIPLYGFPRQDGGQAVQRGGERPQDDPGAHPKAEGGGSGPGRRYARLADAIEEHLKSVRQIDSLLDRYEFVRSPEVLLLHDEECGWISKQREAQGVAQKWVEAMPDTRLSILMTNGEGYGRGEPPQAIFGYSVLPEKARELELPLELHVRALPATSCLHTIVVADDRFSEEPGRTLDIPLRYAKDRGFVITGEPWGNILLVEVAPGARLAPLCGALDSHTVGGIKHDSLCNGERRGGGLPPPLHAGGKGVGADGF